MTTPRTFLLQQLHRLEFLLGYSYRQAFFSEPFQPVQAASGEANGGWFHSKYQFFIRIGYANGAARSVAHSSSGTASSGRDQPKPESSSKGASYAGVLAGLAEDVVIPPGFVIFSIFY